MNLEQRLNALVNDVDNVRMLPHLNNASTSPTFDSHIVAERLRRCLAQLDAIDDYVICELNTFNTPFDRVLEQLRVELNELLVHLDVQHHPLDLAYAA